MTNPDDQDHVVLLGTKGGPAIRPGSPSMPTSSLLLMNSQHIIVDCGLGVTRGLCEAGFDLAKLATIFITHLHSDHYLELGPLIHTAWTAGLKTPVTIFGPTGLPDYLDAFILSMKADIDLRIADEGRVDLESLIEFREIEEGNMIDLAGVSVAAMRNCHPPLVDTFALSFSSDRKKAIFSGDTAFMPEMAEFAHNANILVHEGMLPDGVAAIMERVGNTDDRLLKHIMRSHTAAEDVARIAQMAGVEQLAIHHRVPADDPSFTKTDWERAIRKHWIGPLWVGEDGMRVAF